MATVSRRREAPAKDPFDVSHLDRPAAEHDCLAAVLDLLDREPADAREVVDVLAASMFRDEPNAVILKAISAALLAKDTPKISDVYFELRAACAAAGEDAFAGAKDRLTDLGNERGATGKLAVLAAKSAATEVVEAAAQRAVLLAAADVAAASRSGRLTTDTIGGFVAALTTAQAGLEGRKAPGRRLRVRTAAEIDPKPIEWFWPQRISCGSLTIITGMPGLSKSLLTIDIAARITTGGRWPDGTGSAPKGGVILFGTEDDPETVVVPRLIAADADRSLVRIVEGVEEGQKDWLGAISIDRDLALVREQLDAFPECKAIVFDPLSQFIDAEENSNAATRAALMPLVNLARERNVAVLAVMHLNKKSDSAMIQRIAGASSYGQVARHVLWVANDPDDTATGLDKRRAMLVVKNSHGRSNVGQLYRVSSRNADVPGIEWIAGTVEMDAERLVPRPGGVSQAQQDRRGEAVDSLRDMLAEGQRPAAEIERELKDAGFSRRQIDFACDTLGVTKRQVRPATGARTWVWSLPAGDAAEQPAVHDAIDANSWSPW